MLATDRLLEIEREPWNVVRLDMEAMLDAFNFMETIDGRNGVWYHSGCNAQVVLFKDQPSMARGIVDDICRMIRSLIAKGDLI